MVRAPREESSGVGRSPGFLFVVIEHDLERLRPPLCGSCGSLIRHDRSDPASFTSCIGYILFFGGV